MSDKTRISLLERDQVSPEIVLVYDALLKQRGVVPNMFKTLAHTPALAIGIAGFLKSLLGDTALPGWYKELIASRIAILNDCAYAISAHTLSARQKGASEQQIKSTWNPDLGPFSSKERLGFRCADLLHQGPEYLDESFFQNLKAHFSEPELVELTATAATFEFFCRFVDGLRIPVTPIPETVATQQKGGA
jgi:AhpD family alkylhydroperoxidase